MGIILVIPPDLFSLFAILLHSFNGKKARSGLQLIWHATICLIRKVRNDRLFKICVVMSIKLWINSRFFHGHGV